MAITMPLIILSALYTIMVVNVGSNSDAAQYIVITFISYFTIYAFILTIMLLNMWKDLISHLHGIKIKIK